MMRLIPSGLLIVLAMVGLAMATPTFQAEQPYSHEGVKVSAGQRFPAGQRLAYAALSDLRLIEIEVVSPEPKKSDKSENAEPESHEERTIFPVTRDNNPYNECLNNAVIDKALWKSINAKNFVLSIAAVENYNRGFTRRRLEEATTNALGVVGIRLDPSIGLTQVRLSRARQLLAAKLPVTLNDRETLTFLGDDCNALQTTLWWFEDEIRKARPQGRALTLRELALSYNGGSGASPSEFPYVLIVESAYDVLQQQSGETIEGEATLPSTPTFDAVGCFYFDEVGGKLFAERYAMLGPSGVVETRDRAAFSAFMASSDALTYGAIAPPGWKGPLSGKISAHMDTQAGMSESRWRGHTVKRLDPSQDVQIENACGALLPELSYNPPMALVGRAGPSVIVALQQQEAAKAATSSSSTAEGGQ